MIEIVLSSSTIASIASQVANLWLGASPEDGWSLVLVARYFPEGPSAAWVPGVAGVPAGDLESTPAGGSGRLTTQVAETDRHGVSVPWRCAGAHLRSFLISTLQVVGRRHRGYLVHHAGVPCSDCAC